MFAWHKMIEYKKKKNKSNVFWGELVIDDDNPARKFSEYSNYTYLCMHLKKGLEPPNN